jgi:SMC interacting uncharacterized protein involved in chromosome segregation
MSEEYKVLTENITKFENKMAFAKKGNNQLKAKQFKQLLNELYVKRDELEGKHPKEAFEEIQDQMDKKDGAIEALKKQNEELMEKFNEINKRIEELTKPKETKPEIKPDGKVECPQCHRLFVNLSAHKRHCKKGLQ